MRRLLHHLAVDHDDIAPEAPPRTRKPNREIFRRKIISAMEWRACKTFQGTHCLISHGVIETGML